MWFHRIPRDPSSLKKRPSHVTEVIFPSIFLSCALLLLLCLGHCLAWFEQREVQWAQMGSNGAFLNWWYPKMLASWGKILWKWMMIDDWGYAYFRKPPNKWGKQILIQCRLMWSSTGMNSVPSQLLCLIFPMFFSTRRWDHGVYVMKNNKWFIKTMVEPLRLMISSNPCGFVWKLCTPLLVSHNLFPYFPY